jgi:hypothetical protein
MRTMIRSASADDKGPFQTVQCVKPTPARRQLSIRGTSVKRPREREDQLCVNQLLNRAVSGIRSTSLEYPQLAPVPSAPAPAPPAPGFHSCNRGSNPLRSLLKAWAVHYNRSRPHMGLGPGIPDPPEHRILPTNAARGRLQLGGCARLRVKSILGGLHHEYDRPPACV